MGNESVKESKNKFSHIVGHGDSEKKALDSLYASIIFCYGRNFILF